MRALIRAAGVVVIVAATAQLAGCGDGTAMGTGGGGDSGGLGSASGDGSHGGATGGTGSGGGTGSVSGSVWMELPSPMITVDGGRASGGSGRGSPGGAISIRSGGPATLDPALAPAIPAVPAGATAVGADALATDVTSDASISISGIVVVGGSDAVRRITSNGDIYIEGSLRSASAGGTRQAISLSAPNGTVFVSGAVDTTGVDGQGGGAIDITAMRVVVTGRLASAGGNGADSAGNAGAITITSTTDVVLAGLVRVRGGATTGATAGGAAATLRVEAAGTVQLSGTIDARGGPSAGGGDGGMAGAIRIGETTAPSSVQVLVPMAANGGDGAVAGGEGGGIQVDAAGEIVLSSVLRANGGSIVGAAGDGGTAGTVTLKVTSEVDKLTVTAKGEVTLDGGTAKGAGLAGGGGHLYLKSNDGDMSMAGKLLGRGGAAPDPGGIGGLGGAFELFSDANHNGLGGNLIIEATGLIDVSGGPGTTGGSARNDGGWGIAVFPDMQEQIAVLLNSDGIHGTPPVGSALCLNLGRIVARGGATNGWGGDVIYHGNGADQKDPVSGTVELEGHGTGQIGNYGGE
jgi:hypothetical protein